MKNYLIFALLALAACQPKETSQETPVSFKLSRNMAQLQLHHW